MEDCVDSGIWLVPRQAWLTRNQLMARAASHREANVKLQESTNTCLEHGATIDALRAAGDEAEPTATA